MKIEKTWVIVKFNNHMENIRFNKQNTIKKQSICFGFILLCLYSVCVFYGVLI